MNSISFPTFLRNPNSKYYFFPFLLVFSVSAVKAPADQDCLRGTKDGERPREEVRET